jgi:trehalose 6-phosphate phosphatase
MKSELAELDQKRPMVDEEAPDAVPVPHALVPHLGETAILLDIDGTLLDLMPTPREVWVPPGLSETLNRLTERTSGALAMVSGRSCFARSPVTARRCACRWAMKRTKCMRRRWTRS